MDVEAQAAFWRDGAKEDIAAARCLLAGGHVRQALFLAHLAVEKLLRALVTRHTEDVAPRIYNLVRLAELAGLVPDEENGRRLRALNAHALLGRYPDAEVAVPDEEPAAERLAMAEELMQWPA